jgi:hypothetical protein
MSTEASSRTWSRSLGLATDSSQVKSSATDLSEGDEDRASLKVDRSYPFSALSFARRFFCAREIAALAVADILRRFLGRPFAWGASTPSAPPKGSSHEAERLCLWIAQCRR